MDAIRVPFTASGMQPLSEAEMAAISAKFGASQQRPNTRSLNCPKTKTRPNQKAM